MVYAIVRILYVGCACDAVERNDVFVLLSVSWFGSVTYYKSI